MQRLSSTLTPRRLLNEFTILNSQRKGCFWQQMYQEKGKPLERKLKIVLFDRGFFLEISLKRSPTKIFWLLLKIFARLAEKRILKRRCLARMVFMWIRQLHSRMLSLFLLFIAFQHRLVYCSDRLLSSGFKKWEIGKLASKNHNFKKFKSYHVQIFGKISAKPLEPKGIQWILFTSEKRSHDTLQKSHNWPTSTVRRTVTISYNYFEMGFVIFSQYFISFKCVLSSSSWSSNTRKKSMPLFSRTQHLLKLKTSRSKAPTT